jgi:hypothetical protein
LSVRPSPQKATAHIDRKDRRCNRMPRCSSLGGTPGSRSHLLRGSSVFGCDRSVNFHVVRLHLGRSWCAHRDSRLFPFFTSLPAAGPTYVARAASAEFSTERNVITQAATTPAVAIPELKRQQVLQPNHRHEKVVDVIGHFPTTIVPVRPAQFAAERPLQCRDDKGSPIVVSRAPGQAPISFTPLGLSHRGLLLKSPPRKGRRYCRSRHYPPDIEEEVQALY